MLEQKLVPAATKVGIGRIGWHTFRHSYSTLLRSLKVDVKVQQELLRHADIRTNHEPVHPGDTGRHAGSKQ
jgi:integrase